MKRITAILSILLLISSTAYADHMGHCPVMKASIWHCVQGEWQARSGGILWTENDLLSCKKQTLTHFNGASSIQAGGNMGMHCYYQSANGSHDMMAQGLSGVSVSAKTGFPINRRYGEQDCFNSNPAKCRFTYMSS